MLSERDLEFYNYLKEKEEVSLKSKFRGDLFGLKIDFEKEIKGLFSDFVLKMTILIIKSDKVLSVGIYKDILLENKKKVLCSSMEKFIDKESLLEIKATSIKEMEKLIELLNVKAVYIEKTKSERLCLFNENINLNTYPINLIGVSFKTKLTEEVLNLEKILLKYRFQNQGKNEEILMDQHFVRTLLTIKSQDLNYLIENVNSENWKEFIELNYGY